MNLSEEWVQRKLGKVKKRFSAVQSSEYINNLATISARFYFVHLFTASVDVKGAETKDSPGWLCWSDGGWGCDGSRERRQFTTHSAARPSQTGSYLTSHNTNKLLVDFIKRYDTAIIKRKTCHLGWLRRLFSHSPAAQLESVPGRDSSCSW